MSFLHAWQAPMRGIVEPTVIVKGWRSRPSIASLKSVMVCLMVVLLSGCQKKQRVVQVEPKPQQVTTTQVPSSTATPSEVSGLLASSEKPSEQQTRALRQYNENVWFFHEAMQVAPWDQTLSAGVSKLVKAAAPDWDHANPTHAEIRGAEVATRLRPWLEMAQKLEPAKQAAALLVADRIVVMEEEDGNLESQDSEKPAAQGESSGKRPKSAAQVELETMGAQFIYEEGSERYFYAFNWLLRAYEVGSKTRAGELAFLALMKRGFDVSVNCTNGSDQFREVIRRGGEYLREHRSTDVEARVHIMMGDAYRDIVALAVGQLPENQADANTYKPEEANARTKAIAEYRAGMALDDKSEASKIARQHLGSLEAGEAPHDTRFYCQLLD